MTVTREMSEWFGLFSEKLSTCGSQQVAEEMRKGEVPLKKYEITKSLTKPPEAYPDAKNQPHVQVIVVDIHSSFIYFL